jgi:hypothetical protein
MSILPHQRARGAQRAGLPAARGRRRGWLAALVIALWAAAPAALHAAALREAEVPAPLRPWVPWVLQDHETIACPAAYNEASRHECVWPARLTLALTAQGGSFSFDVEVFAPDTLVLLPGQAEAWPRAVRANGRALALTQSGGRPALRLAPGHFVIEGAFAWREMPQGIALPPNTGLVDARRDGRPLGWPDSGGQLWLRPAAALAAEPETLTVRVYRRIDDEIPMRLTTRIELTASGRPREVRLPAALLPGFVVLGISSPLPARLQPDGALRVQLRAGNWSLDVEGRSRAPVGALAAPGGEEVWSFAARNDLRIVDLQPAGGAAAVDPRQAGAPGDWQRLPAFHMPPRASLKLAERRRGDPEPEADKLALQRTLWLDFDGAGFTARDAIRGTISRSWRLDAVPALAVGRATIGGQGQFITRLPGTDAGSGVEVRQGNAQIEAESRIGFAHALPVTGWQADFDRVSIDLRLPPGWRLLHAGGADAVAGSWVAQWTLWDFFFVLLIVAASWKLHGRAAALALGAALALTWHLPGAPSWPWLVLLGLSAVRTALAARSGERMGRVAWWLRLGWNATLAAVALALLPFAVGELRAALYPALEATQTNGYTARGAIETKPSEAELSAPAPPEASAPAAAGMAANEALQQNKRDVRTRERNEERLKKSAPLSSLSSAAPQAQLLDLMRQDPNAKIQTGPGLPDWRWQSYAVNWFGPVERSQRLTLWLEPPWVTRSMTVLALLLIAAAIWLHARRASGTGGAAGAGRVVPPEPGPAQVAGVALVVLCVAALCWPCMAGAESAEPDWPSDARLEQLRERLQRPAPCQPDCAQLARLDLSAQGTSLRLQLEFHTGADVFVPLPGGSNWHPVEVRADGGAARLRRDDFDRGSLWIRLPAGIHQVTMAAELSSAQPVQIALPLAPKFAHADLSGWTLEGIDARGLASGALTLTPMRVARADRVEDAGEAIPAFVRVVRTVQLDQQWTVATEIIREGPAPAPLAVRVPLLAGEAVTDPSVRVQGGFAVITLGTGANAAFSSSLEVQPRLKLHAADEPNQIEIWRLDVTPMWHASFSGIAPTQRQLNERWLPQWQPWPGENLTIDVVRPEGVAGSTLTIEQVDLTTRPGRRATDVSATIRLHSSQGGNHAIELPQGAELRAVRIDGQPQPIRAEGRRVTLPLSPGVHTATLEWREPRGIDAVFDAARAELGAPAVNLSTAIALPPDRWVLATGGPVLGPAVLFWGLALVIVAAAWVLARLRWAPLGFVDWLLLGIGVAQASLAGAVFVAAVLVLVQARGRFGERLDGARFNLMQLVLAAAALVALLILFNAVRTGLLGTPHMLIMGNGSSSNYLRWYADRSSGAPPAAWVFSLPLWVYRVVMLAWALWLALLVVRCARWMWGCFAAGRLWGRWRRRAAAPPAAAASPAPG